MADESVDAIWFARGGYGSNRIAEAALSNISVPAMRKTYLGYSDAGFLLAGCTSGVRGGARADAARCLREGGRRRWSARSTGCWPAIRKRSNPAWLGPAQAYNLTVLSNLLGTAVEPDLARLSCWSRKCQNIFYRIDRTMFHVTASANVRRSAGSASATSATCPINDPVWGVTKKQLWWIGAHAPASFMAPCGNRPRRGQQGRPIRS
jgi:muramoyltetrapeptide carboxypeptidase